MRQIMKNKLQKDLFCFCLLLCLSLFGMYGGCGKNNSPAGSSDYVTKQKIFPDKKNKIEVTEQSPIQGTAVIFEKNSIKRPQIVSISPADKPSKLPSPYKAAGKLVRFSTNGSSRFAKPVLVKLPYLDSDQDTSIDGSTISETQTKVLYWDDSMNKWQTKEVIGIEKQNNLAKFETTHFSVYLTAIQEQNEDITDDNENQFLTGESFIGVPEFSWTQDTETGEWQKQMTDPGGGPEYMTVRRNETDLQAVVGPFITTGTSHPATINTPNCTSATFNASNI